MEKTAVLFDMDGVLVASGPAHSASWKLVARKHGIHMTDAVFQASFGQRSADIVRSIWGDQLSEERIREIDDAKEAAYRELFAAMVPLTIGVRETLAGLRDAGIPLALASSGPPENIELMLRDKRLEGVFDAIVTGRDVQRGKPAPDCFLIAAERLRVVPASCVVVEDALVGVEAALAAEMKAIGFVGTFPAEELRAAGCAAIAERMSDIRPELIRQLVLEAER